MIALTLTLALFSDLQSEQAMFNGTQNEERFGAGVAMSGDRVVTASLLLDELSIFVRSGSQWTLESTVAMGNSARLALNYRGGMDLDGDTLVVAHTGGFCCPDGVRVFQRSGTSWLTQADLTSSSSLDDVGWARSVALDGDTLAVGSEFGGMLDVNDQVGSVTIFRRTGTTWDSGYRITPSDGQITDRFGWSVDISGDTLIAGAPFRDDFGLSSGAAYVFEWDGIDWVETVRLNQFDAVTQDWFGESVSIDGERIVVGAPLKGHGGEFQNSGAVYPYERQNGVWVGTGKLRPGDTAGDQRFGDFVDLEGDSLVVSRAGGVYRYRWTPDGWAENALLASTAWTPAQTGAYCRVEGDWVAAGVQFWSPTDQEEGALFLFDSPPVPEAPVFCTGDGGDQMGCVDCPCQNNADPGSISGCVNSTGVGAELLLSGTPSLAADSLRFELRSANPNTFAVLVSGIFRAPANLASPCFGTDSGVPSFVFNGLRCVVQGLRRHGSRATDSSGDVGLTTPGWGPPSGPPSGLLDQLGLLAGATRHFQAIYRETPTVSCTANQNTSQGMSITIVP